LELFQEVMIHHPIKIYKMIQQLQYQLSRRSFSEQKQFVYELLQKYALSTFLAIKYKEAREDICKFGAEYFFVLCFQPEYWKDSNLIIKKDKNGERIVTYDLDMKKISRKKIEQFLQMTKEEFIYFAEQYKKIKVVEIHRNSAICLLKDQEQYYEEFDEEVLKNYRNLLYMDIPKYIREYQRFAFDSFQLIDILKLLVRYEGNWILTWKNYVHKEFAGEESDSLFHKIKIQDKEEEDISVDYLFSYLKIIEENLNRIHKELWVFKYRNKNKSDTNSIVFITNIQFPSISINDFLCRYFGTDTIKGTLTQETFSKFSKTAFKFDPQGL
ncbi:MAG: hypothetical protein IKJ01_06990, partial [Lachnospiraceae bacterium]|nr:hypothetical protein [Lachnospiraceae bacterium]